MVVSLGVQLKVKVVVIPDATAAVMELARDPDTVPLVSLTIPDTAAEVVPKRENEPEPLIDHVDVEVYDRFTAMVVPPTESLAWAVMAEPEVHVPDSELSDAPPRFMEPDTET